MRSLKEASHPPPEDGHEGIGYAELFHRHTGGKFFFHSPQSTAESAGGNLVLVVGSGVVSGKATSILLAPVKSVRSFPLPGTGVELYNQTGKTGTCNGDGDNKGRVSPWAGGDVGHPYSLAGETSRVLWGALGFQERPALPEGKSSLFRRPS